MKFKTLTETLNASNEMIKTIQEGRSEALPMLMKAQSSIMSPLSPGRADLKLEAMA